MTRQTFPRRLLDDAIDRAVHDLVQADPRPGLRRRVLAKLEAPAERVWWVPRLLVPAGALLTIALLAVWMRPSAVVSVPDVVVRQPAPAATPAAQPQVAGPRQPAAAPPPQTATRREAPVPFTFGPRSDRVTATSVTTSAPSEEPGATAEGSAEVFSAVESSPVLPPLRVAPIAPPADIVLKPIELKPITLASARSQ